MLLDASDVTLELTTQGDSVCAKNEFDAVDQLSDPPPVPPFFFARQTQQPRTLLFETREVQPYQTHLVVLRGGNRPRLPHAAGMRPRTRAHPNSTRELKWVSNTTP